MVIAEKTYAEVAYKLTVDGVVVDQADDSRPLPFVYGKGLLLPKFEEQLNGKGVGETVSFTLSPEDGYGEHNAEYINPYPREMFCDEEGNFDEKVVFVGAMLQLSTPEGHPLMAKVAEIGETEVILDFNPPMAGKTLNFEVTVVSVREEKPEDMAMFMGNGGNGEGGCGCGDCGCDSNEGGCGSEGSCCS